MELREILRPVFERSSVIRLTGGHERGKSEAIAERIRWLVRQGGRPESICVLSHTMQSLRVLRYRMTECIGDAYSKQSERVRFSTPHYVAQQISAIVEHGNLPELKYDPTIGEWERRELKAQNCHHLIDTWEAREMFDAEFAVHTGWPLQRCQEVRETCEALWCGGQYASLYFDGSGWQVSEEEGAAFLEFLRGRESFYMYAVQGRHIRRALEQCEASEVQAGKVIDARHLIVDEYQDLNWTEIAFVDKLIESTDSVVVVGDPGDCVGWAITATRFSWPRGFEEFTEKHPDCIAATLPIKVGCHPVLWDAAQALRLSKDGEEGAVEDVPPAFSRREGAKDGVLSIWRFRTSVAEAEAIAQSCRTLIAAGLPAHEILILLPDDDLPCTALLNSLEANQVPYLHPDKVPYLESDESHFIVAFLDVAWLKHDYISCGSFLSMMTGSDYDVQTRVASKAVEHGLGVEDMMSRPLPTGIFDEEEVRLVEEVKELVGHLQAIEGSEVFINTRVELGRLAGKYLGSRQEDIWKRDAVQFPDDASLEEVKYCLVADDLYQWERMFEAIFKRRGRSVVTPVQVRICRTRFSRGVSAGVVFVPGLEESRVPGKCRARIPLLLRESARRLKLAVTRARQACILSYAETSDLSGPGQGPSRFLHRVGSFMEDRSSALSTEEIRAVLAA